MASNECIPYYDDGDNITGWCSNAVTGKTFVTVGPGDRTGPDFDPTATANPSDGGCIHIEPAAAGQVAPVFGVAAYDGAASAFVDVIRGSKMVVPVTASAAIAINQEVEVGPNGQAAPHAAGFKCGYAVSSAGAGEDAQISLY
jgi:hypothetical protein